VTKYRRKHTDRQRIHKQTLTNVYRFIEAFLEERRFPPSYEDIGKGCYMSRATVMRYLDVLEAHGYIGRELGIPRSIHLTDKPFDL